MTPEDELPPELLAYLQCLTAQEMDVLIRQAERMITDPNISAVKACMTPAGQVAQWYMRQKDR